MLEFSEGQLVKVRYIVNVTSGEVISTEMNENNLPEYKRDFDFKRLSAWLRVKMMDNDDTFIGEVERVERNMWSELEINFLSKQQQVRVAIDRVCEIEDQNMEFCYSDGVSQCSCPGLCREK